MQLALLVVVFGRSESELGDVWAKECCIWVLPYNELFESAFAFLLRYLGPRVDQLNALDGADRFATLSLRVYPLPIDQVFRVVPNLSAVRILGNYGEGRQEAGHGDDILLAVLLRQISRRRRLVITRVEN